MKKLVVSVLVAVAAMACSQAVAGGVTYHWKGTEVVHNFPQSPSANVDCAFWTNANNWVEGVVPGEYKDADGNTIGTPDATVIFGALPDGGLSMVNIQGLYTVSNVIISSDAPSYTIGVSLDTSKELFRPYSTHGRITIEAGAPAQDIRVLACCSERKNTGADWNANAAYPVLVNNSSETLTIEKFGQCGYPGATYGAGEFPFGFGGSGNIRILAMGARVHTVRFMMHQTTGGKLTFACDCGASTSEYWARLVASRGDNVTRELCIEDGKNFVFGQNWGGFDVSGSGSMLKVTGGGTLKFVNIKKNNGTFISTPHTIDAGAKLRIETKLAGWNDAAGFHWYEGAGTVELVGENATTGMTDLLASSGATLSVASIGGEMSGGVLGYGGVRVANSGRILYTGAGETCDRTIHLHNHTYGICNSVDSAATPAGVIEQGGTGPLVVNSEVVVDGTVTGALKLANSTDQDATWAASLVDSTDAALAVTKTGTGKWTLSGENTYTGATTIQGGTLEVANAAALGETSGIVVDTAAVTLKVADGVALPVLAMTQSGSGKLDVVLGEGASAKVSLPEGVAPAWLTVNGTKAEVKSDGTLAAYETKWVSATDGAWNTIANWDNGLPDASKPAKIAVPGTYTVSVSAAAANPVCVIDQTAGALAVSALLAVTEKVNVGEGASFEMTDGNLVLASAAKSTGEFRLDGGSASFSGGTVNITNFYGFTGSGTLAFSGTAKVNSRATEGYDVTFAADENGELDVSFTGKSYIYVGGGLGSLNFGGRAGGFTKATITRQDNFAGTTASVGMGMNVGYGNGTAELLCNHNYGYISAGNAGVAIGRGRTVDGMSSPTGTLKIVGNKFTAGGVGFWWNAFWGGLSVGNGIEIKDGYGSRAVGRVELSGSMGSLSVSGACGIGVGRADGVIVQNDGTFSYNGSSSWSSQPTRYHPMVVGYAGGDGSYVISNGTATINNGAIFVGGCLAKDLGRYTSLSTTYVQSGKKDSVGLLAARGGTFTQKYASGIIIGADGTGRLEVGPAGTLTTPYLAISNNVSGTLAFELGADGRAGTLVATNLTIAAGAKLVVDARGAKRLRTWTKLASLENAPVGAFAAGDVTVLVNDTYAERFANPEVFYERNGEKGVFLKGEDIGLSVIVR